MSGFVPSALGGFVQGMRMSDEDQRRENRQALATRYADDQHNVSSLNLQTLQQKQADDSDFRTELKDKYNTSPGKASALTLNAQMTPYRDEADYRKELQDNGYSVPGERVKKTITEAEAREHQHDLRTTVQGFISAKQSGNWEDLTNAMSKTHLGGGGNGKAGRTYTPEWTDTTLKITDSKGDVILDLVGKDKDDLALKVEQALTQSVANPDVYFAGRAKERSALNLEQRKHAYKLDEIRATAQVKAANSDNNKRYITLPTADRRGERISFEDARKELTDIGKFLKEKSGKEGMSFFVDTNVNVEDLYKTDTGKMAIQRIEEIAADKSNPRAQGYAQRFLTIVDSMYGVSAQNAVNPPPAPNGGKADPDSWENY